MKRTMKAVRSTGDGVSVVDLDQPPGAGELLAMKATSVCASDLLYIRVGSRFILGHELAGVREDGTGVIVEALYGCKQCAECRRGAYNLCATHGQRATGPGKRVAVVGAGALGLLAAAAARRQGSQDVAIEARHDHQRKAAERLGARIDPEGLYEVVVEAAGTPASLARAIALVAPGGTVVVPAEAFRVAGDGASGAIRVVIEPT